MYVKKITCTYINIQITYVHMFNKNKEKIILYNITYNNNRIFFI